MRHGSPALVMTMFRRPVLGEPRIDQATPATSGGTNSGSIPVLAISPLHGVSVRTTTHAKASPITTASSVPPPQAIRELPSAAITLALVATTRKLPIETSV